MPKRTETTILVVNPGSTSTKLALYTGPPGAAEVHESRAATLPAPPTRPGDLRAELRAREAGVIEFARAAGSIDCVAARGGLVKPVPAGSYPVTRGMVDDLLLCRYGRHASNLGAPLASIVAERYACPAIITDPVGVDELDDVARYSGLREIERKSFSHALNLRAVARRAADAAGTPFDRSRLVGVHLGGGISVASMVGGKIVDVNDSNEGGPFTPQRTGSLPVLQLVDLCFCGAYADAEALKTLLTTKGGLASYIGTSSVKEALGRIEAGDLDAERVMRAMVYQIAKEIGAAAAALDGRLDAVFLTGGFARPPVAGWIEERVDWIAPVMVFPGEGEMQALAEAALRFLRGEERLREY